MSKSTVTAATVREFFRADEKRMARLPEAAQVTVAKGARGRLHPEVIAEFNKRRKADRRYEVGASGAVVAERKAQRKALAESGVAVGKRGPLSKDALAALKG